MDGQDLRNFRAAPLRGRLEALLLDHAADAEPAAVVDFKEAAIGALQGTVVEMFHETSGRRRGRRSAPSSGWCCGPTAGCSTAARWTATSAA